MANFKKNNQALIIIIFIIIFNLIFIDAVFSQQARNPFKDWFPVIKKEETKGKPAEIKQEVVFDVSRFKLQGIVWGSVVPKAVINDKIYSVGDKLDEAQIKDINKEGVLLIFNEKEYKILRNNPLLNQEPPEPLQEKPGGKK